MRPLFALVALAALTVACGGGNTPTSPSLPSLPTGPSGITILTRGTVRATVDGVPWESSTPFAAVGQSFGSVPPLLTLSATAPGYTMSISIPATVGTFESGGSTFASITLSEGFANMWSVSPFVTGGSARWTITTATATRVAGTFSFTAVARTQGITPATRTVTNGTFDVSQ
jgi:Family of unknown function (DUF6252)